MATAQTSGGGIGLPTLLTIIFVVLKLTDVIAWSWVWVLSPLWISFILFLVILIPVILLVRKQEKSLSGRLNRYGRSLR